MTLEVILGIITALLTGTNIWQFVFIRQERQKYQAQAQMASTEAKEKEVDLASKRIQILEDHLNTALEVNKQLDEARKEDNEKYFNEVVNLRNEIISLKTTVGELTNEISELKQEKNNLNDKACDIATKCAKRVRKPSATTSTKKTSKAKKEAVEPKE